MINAWDGSNPLALKANECLRKQVIIDCTCTNSELSNRENTMMNIRNNSEE